MSESALARSRPAIFYGWWIVGVGFLSQAVAIGLMAYSAGNFVKPVVAELGGTRFTGMVGVVAMNAVMSLASPFLGYALDRSSVRVLMAVGGLVDAAPARMTAKAPAREAFRG